ncbi:MAG: hypothetical protein GF364_02000, partial [Candidatus Lokiarchaeota archaeon]|nr:hypothetical protein [Candidatus Lokiarchaeota archaeon]
MTNLPKFEKPSDYLDFGKISDYVLIKSVKYLNSEVKDLQKYCEKQLNEEDRNILEDILASLLDETNLQVLGKYDEISINYTFNINKKYPILTIKSFTFNNNKDKDTGKRQFRALFHTTTEAKIGGTTAQEFGYNFSTGQFIYPKGVGISFIGTILDGGGYLHLDHDNGYYAGMFNLNLMEKIDVTATTIFMTKMPEGPDFLSLFISIAAKFSPPVQLGYGFALNGVGGLFALYRKLNVQAIKDIANSTQSLNNLMFPEDPIKNAVSLIKQIDKTFPPTKGYHVFGPFVSLIWGGTAKLVEFSVGLFISLKIDALDAIVLIGTARVELPNEDLKIIRLNIDITGTWDLANKEFMVFGSIYDSKILEKFPLSGDMVFLIRYGKDSNVVFSAGGFHPNFFTDYNQSLKGYLPSMERLYFGLSGKHKKFSLKSYLAITTNTLQFGADASITLKFAGVKLHGDLGFDTLIQFYPFLLDLIVRFSADLSYKGWDILSLGIKCNVKGPNQWRAKGTARFSILGFGVKKKFNKKWGKKKEEKIEYINPSETLISELQNNKLEYIAPKWNYEGVIFTEDAADKLSAFGDIVIKQELIPLNCAI